MSDSVENEWLCGQILAEFGLAVAKSEIAKFEDQQALVVERFDRVWSEARSFWLRLPQEDMCQARGLPPHMKYENDGGPGIVNIATLLRASVTPEQDVECFLKAQLIMWLLAATDGHAKNFSIRLMPGGRFSAHSALRRALRLACHRPRFHAAANREGQDGNGAGGEESALPTFARSNAATSTPQPNDAGLRLGRFDAGD